MPQIRMRDAAAVLRTISRIRMRDGGGVLRTIQRVRMRDAAGVLRTVWEYLSVVLDVYYVYGLNGGAASYGVVTTATVTATVTGGTAPFTYLWEYVSGDLGISADTPTADNTTFSATVSDTSNAVAYFRLKVTDTNGSIVYSEQVAIELQWYDTR